MFGSWGCFRAERHRRTATDASSIALSVSTPKGMLKVGLLAHFLLAGPYINVMVVIINLQAQSPHPFCLKLENGESCFRQILGCSETRSRSWYRIWSAQLGK